jgi:serine/threonine-protein kinase
MHLKEGHRLHNEKYQLLNILGEGGFSLTYRGAWKTEVRGILGKVPTLVPVCIKEYYFKDYCRRNLHTGFVETNTETGKEIFEKNKETIIKEARILSVIHHPYVVNVLEVFKQNNTVYIVMEFIAGHSLKQEVEQNGVLSEEKLKDIIFKIGQALDYIHNKNILHLDIKPSNILMDNNNNPKLIDFGISKRYDLSDDQETSTTLQAASKGYASVEQYDSEGMQVFSPRPDIYSLGATMYYLVTAQVPTESILRTTKGLENPRKLNPKLSEETEKVILKSMALKADDRYETIMDMLNDLGYNPETDKISLLATSDNEAEQDELIKKMGEQPYDADLEDETVINRTNEEKNKEKRKKIFLAFLVASLFVIGMFFFMSLNNRNEDTSGNHGPIQENPEVRPQTNNGQTNPPDVHTGTSTTTPPDTGEKLKTTVPLVDEAQLNYARFFSNALQAYSQNDYNKALKLFQEAEKFDKTADTENYIRLCEQELEKIEIQKKKDLYDFRSNFGIIFAVVKKKSNGLYGAIDDKGNEIIPCKYVNSIRSDTNRLFQRADNLYDLYTPSGALLMEGTKGF